MRSPLRNTLKTLPDLVNEDLKVLFVGTNPGVKSARIGHYFAGTSNMFWRLLYESSLTEEKLTTDLDYKILDYGYGLTDVVKRPTRSTTELRKVDGHGARKRLDEVIKEYEPKIVSFVGKTGYRYYLDDGLIPLEYGNQKIEICSSQIFLLPSTSGASFADTKYHEKLYWYKRLRSKVKRIINN